MHFTQNPIGSDDQLDLQDNAISFDYAMNSPAALWQDRFGKQHKTVQQALKDVGFKPAGFDFVSGGTLGIGDRDKCVFYPTDGYWYSWNGKLPYVVPANSSPTTRGKKGWGPVDFYKDKIISREALRRTYQEVGLNLVDGSFEQGGSIKTALDVILEEKTGNVFTSPIGNIAPGSTPINGVNINIKTFSARANSVNELIGMPLLVGSVIYLNCYHFIFDGSNHTRIIEKTDNGTGIRLNNGFWANIPLGTSEIDISWMGARRSPDFDSLPFFQKALSVFKSVKFSGHYYISNSIEMDNGYSLRGENINSSILEIVSPTPELVKGIISYDKPVIPGVNPACLFTNLSSMTLLSNINQSNWSTDGSGMVKSGIYASPGSGLAGGVAQSILRDIKIIGCLFVIDIREGYLNSIDNIRGEKCHNGVSIIKGTSYSIGLISVVQVKNFCFKFDNVLYSNIKNLVADFCEVEHFLLSANSDISIGSIGAEVISGISNMYRLTNSKITVGTTRYITITTTNNPSDYFYYLEYGSFLHLLTDYERGDGYGIAGYSVSQSDLIIGNLINIRRAVYQNEFQYTSYDLNQISGSVRSYGKLFQFSGNNMPGPGNWVIDFVSTTSDIGSPGKGSLQVATSMDTGEIKRRRYAGDTWTPWV